MDVNGEIMAVPLSALSSFYTYFFILSVGGLHPTESRLNNFPLWKLQTPNWLEKGYGRSYHRAGGLQQAEYRLNNFPFWKLQTPNRLEKGYERSYHGYYEPKRKYYNRDNNIRQTKYFQPDFAEFYQYGNQLTVTHPGLRLDLKYPDFAKIKDKQSVTSTTEQHKMTLASIKIKSKQDFQPMKGFSVMSSNSSFKNILMNNSNFEVSEETESNSTNQLLYTPKIKSLDDRDVALKTHIQEIPSSPFIHNYYNSSIASAGKTPFLVTIPYNRFYTRPYQPLKQWTTTASINEQGIVDKSNFKSNLARYRHDLAKANLKASLKSNDLSLHLLETLSSSKLNTVKFEEEARKGETNTFPNILVQNNNHETILRDSQKLSPTTDNKVQTKGYFADTNKEMSARKTPEHFFQLDSNPNFDVQNNIQGLQNLFHYQKSMSGISKKQIRVIPEISTITNHYFIVDGNDFDPNDEHFLISSSQLKKLKGNNIGNTVYKEQKFIGETAFPQYKAIDVLKNVEGQVQRPSKTDKPSLSSLSERFMEKHSQTSLSDDNKPNENSQHFYNTSSTSSSIPPKNHSFQNMMETNILVLSDSLSTREIKNILNKYEAEINDKSNNSLNFLLIQPFRLKNSQDFQWKDIIRFLQALENQIGIRFPATYNLLDEKMDFYLESLKKNQTFGLVFVEKSVPKNIPKLFSMSDVFEAFDGRNLIRNQGNLNYTSGFFLKVVPKEKWLFTNTQQLFKMLTIESNVQFPNREQSEENILTKANNKTTVSSIIQSPWLSTLLKTLPTEKSNLKNIELSFDPSLSTISTLKTEPNLFFATEKSNLKVNPTNELMFDFISSTMSSSKVEYPSSVPIQYFLNLYIYTLSADQMLYFYSSHYKTTKEFHEATKGNFLNQSKPSLFKARKITSQLQRMLKSAFDLSIIRQKNLGKSVDYLKQPSKQLLLYLLSTEEILKTRFGWLKENPDIYNSYLIIGNNTLMNIQQNESKVDEKSTSILVVHLDLNNQIVRNVSDSKFLPLSPPRDENLEFLYLTQNDVMHDDLDKSLDSVLGEISSRVLMDYTDFLFPEEYEDPNESQSFENSEPQRDLNPINKESTSTLMATPIIQRNSTWVDLSTKLEKNGMLINGITPPMKTQSISKDIDSPKQLESFPLNNVTLDGNWSSTKRQIGLTSTTPSILDVSNSKTTLRMRHQINFSELEVQEPVKLEVTATSSSYFTNQRLETVSQETEDQDEQLKNSKTLITNNFPLSPTLSDNFIQNQSSDFTSSTTGFTKALESPQNSTQIQGTTQKNLSCSTTTNGPLKTNNISEDILLRNYLSISSNLGNTMKELFSPSKINDKTINNETNSSVMNSNLVPKIIEDSNRLILLNSSTPEVINDIADLNAHISVPKGRSDIDFQISNKTPTGPSYSEVNSENDFFTQSRLIPNKQEEFTTSKIEQNSNLLLEVKSINNSFQINSTSVTDGIFDSVNLNSSDFKNRDLTNIWENTSTEKSFGQDAFKMTTALEGNNNFSQLSPLKIEAEAPIEQILNFSNSNKQFEQDLRSIFGNESELFKTTNSINSSISDNFKSSSNHPLSSINFSATISYNPNKVRDALVSFNEDLQSSPTSQKDSPFQGSTNDQSTFQNLQDAFRNSSAGLKEIFRTEPDQSDNSKQLKAKKENDLGDSLQVQSEVLSTVRTGYSEAISEKNLETVSLQNNQQQGQTTKIGFTTNPVMFSQNMSSDSTEKIQPTEATTFNYLSLNESFTLPNTSFENSKVALPFSQTDLPKPISQFTGANSWLGTNNASEVFDDTSKAIVNPVRPQSQEKTSNNSNLNILHLTTQTLLLDFQVPKESSLKIGRLLELNESTFQKISFFNNPSFVTPSSPILNSTNLYSIETNLMASNLSKTTSKPSSVPVPTQFVGPSPFFDRVISSATSMSSLPYLPSNFSAFILPNVRNTPPTNMTSSVSIPFSFTDVFHPFTNQTTALLGSFSFERMTAPPPTTSQHKQNQPVLVEISVPKTTPSTTALDQKQNPTASASIPKPETPPTISLLIKSQSAMGEVSVPTASIHPITSQQTLDQTVMVKASILETATIPKISKEIQNQSVLVETYVPITLEYPITSQQKQNQLSLVENSVPVMAAPSPTSQQNQNKSDTAEASDPKALAVPSNSKHKQTQPVLIEALIPLATTFTTTSQQKQNQSVLIEEASVPFISTFTSTSQQKQTQPVLIEASIPLTTTFTPTSQQNQSVLIAASVPLMTIFATTTQKNENQSVIAQTSVPITLAPSTISQQNQNLSFITETSVPLTLAPLTTSQQKQNQAVLTEVSVPLVSTLQISPQKKQNQPVTAETFVSITSAPSMTPQLKQNQSVLIEAFVPLITIFTTTSQQNQSQSVIAQTSVPITQAPSTTSQQKQNQSVMVEASVLIAPLTTSQQNQSQQVSYGVSVPLMTTSQTTLQPKQNQSVMVEAVTNNPSVLLLPTLKLPRLQNLTANIEVILTGGRNEFFVPMGTVDIINESGPCRSTAVMPSTLYDHMATYVNGKIVLCGGHTGATHIVTNRCWYFEQKLKTWVPMLDLPQKMYNSAVITMENKIFIIGGWTDSPSDEVFIYDDETKEWQQGPKLGATRYSPCAVVDGQQIIVTGGTSSLPNGQTADLDTVEQLDTSNSLGWFGMPRMRSKRRQHGCAIVHFPTEKGILVAGGSGLTADVHTSVEFFSLTSSENKWRQLAPLVLPRCCWPQMGPIGSSIYIISGEKGPSNTLERFDTNNMKWNLFNKTLPQKRVQSKAIFLPVKAFPGCKV